MARALKAEDLLAGAGTEHTVEIPAHFLAAGGEVILRPLTVRDIQRVTQAAKEQAALTSILMVQLALLRPAMSVEQVSGLPAGLVEFLLQQVNRVSGLALHSDDVDTAIRQPLTRACFALSREFGWTPEQCSQLTVGQILLYLEMLARDTTAATVNA